MGGFLKVVGCVALMAAGGAAAGTPEVRILDAAVTEPTVAEVTRGSLDSRFTASSYRETASRGDAVWLRLTLAQPAAIRGIPVLNVYAGMLSRIQLYAAVPETGGAATVPQTTPVPQGASLPDAAPQSQGVPLPQAARLPDFAGGTDLVFILPASAQTLYARVEPTSGRFEEPRFSTSTLDAVLAFGAARARIVALAFGALASMAIAALLIWAVLSEKTFILYGTLFMLQALYVGYFSGQAFDWPILSHALPLTHYAWNIPAALSGAVACLFVREIADLNRFSPRVYTAFGGLAAAFVLLTFANLAKLIGFGAVVNDFGNILFLGAAIFTLVVAFIAWRRGNRAAGWFLLAWTLLEAFTIAATIRLLLNSSGEHDRLIYYGMPLSMVAAALLIALGLADRLREQRVALSDAERRAQTDSLTGVLNRRSLIERLDAACLRARARGLPISLLFIDLDHFKQINDSFGHPAGDACLAAIIPPMQAELRQSDVIGRYGGEEFVVILSSADAAAAHPIAQRILERVAAVRVEGFGPPIALTCSIGVATSDTLGVWGEKLIAQADAAVYAAKRSGRNRVQFAMPLAA